MAGFDAFAQREAEVALSAMEHISALGSGVSPDVRSEITNSLRLAADCIENTGKDTAEQQELDGERIFHPNTLSNLKEQVKALSWLAVGSGGMLVALEPLINTAVLAEPAGPLPTVRVAAGVITGALGFHKLNAVIELNDPTGQQG